MPRFEIHLLFGALLGLLLQNYPAAAFSLVLGAVFPDIDSKRSITHHGALLLLGVIGMAVFYPYGLLVSVAATLGLVATFYLILPKHRGWMHKVQGQVFFSTLCFLVTLDPVVAVTGFIGTTLHRILDRV